MDAEQTAAEFVQRWAEAVLRQAARTRKVRARVTKDDRAYDYNEEWSPSPQQIAANYRELWTEEHMLVWSAHQLERWRARLAEERGMPAPPEDENLRTVRGALEHLDEVALGDLVATPPEGKPKHVGRSLRSLPNEMLMLDVAGRGPLFEILDRETIEAAALAVVKSIEDELDQRAMDHYADLMRGK
ncbi:hypothetical protein ACI2LJ_35960 [Streptomyces sp. NPDC088090]|uniref:hypothetical protein n=1 Tax=Streptomyces sp. NPDC088090 TaxID=3365822 RepID=UPI003850ADF1